MQVLGEMIIGRTALKGTGPEMRAINPATGAAIDPAYRSGGASEVDRACRLAEEAYTSYAATNPVERAAFLEAIADNLMALGDVLLDRAMLETGLPRARIAGEQARTATQLRMFADVVRRGLWRDAVIDSGDPERTPSPRPELRKQKVPIGPVAVFGSSNFPLLYSVAGGDTASALAAGCPVIVKAHFSHIGTSELVARAIQKAVADAGFHEGVFSLVIGEGNAIGEALVDHPLVQAVGFTGSEGGGMALVRRGQARSQPIPVFAEMTSVNPNIVLPGALSKRAEQIGRRFVDQLALGVGQMCLKPGMIVAVRGEGYDALRRTLHDAISAKPAATMLNAATYANFQRGVAAHEASDVVTTVGAGLPADGSLEGAASVFEIRAVDLLAQMHLADEMFGPAAVLVGCDDADELASLLRQLNGQLTVAFHTEPEDVEAARALLPIAERKTGRILFNGYSNEVEISDASIHGGPYPATSDPRFTSVGSSSIDRFLRPVCYQNFPAELLPEALRDENPYRLWRIRDREPERA